MCLVKLSELSGCRTSCLVTLREAIRLLVVGRLTGLVEMHCTRCFVDVAAGQCTTVVVGVMVGLLLVLKFRLASVEAAAALMRRTDRSLVNGAEIDMP